MLTAMLTAVHVIQVLERAAAAGIDIISFVPHSTHICQPLDSVIMSLLKRHYAQAHSARRAAMNAAGVKYTEMMSEKEALRTLAYRFNGGHLSWDLAMIPAHIRSAFKKCGFSPCNLLNVVKI